MSLFSLLIHQPYMASLGSHLRIPHPSFDCQCMKHMAYGQRNLNNQTAICLIIVKKTIQEFSMCMYAQILLQTPIETRSKWITKPCMENCLFLPNSYVLHQNGSCIQLFFLHPYMLPYWSQPTQKFGLLWHLYNPKHDHGCILSKSSSSRSTPWSGQG